MAIDDLYQDENGLPIYPVRICREAHFVLLRRASHFQFMIYAELTSLRDPGSGTVGVRHLLLAKYFKDRFATAARHGKAAVEAPNPTQIEWAILKLKEFGLVDISEEACKELKKRIKLFMPLEKQYDEYVQETYGLSKKNPDFDTKGLIRVK